MHGYASDQPDKLANTMLAIMAKLLFTKKTVLIKLIPVHTLTSLLLKEYIDSAVNIVNEAGGHAVGLICDNNRVNQACFKLFKVCCLIFNGSF